MSVIVDLDHMGISVCYAGVAREETRLLIQSPLRELVWVAQLQDRLLQAVRKHIKAGRPHEFSMEEDGTIFLSGRLCVPQKAAVKVEILRDAHRSTYMSGTTIRGTLIGGLRSL